MSQPEIPPPTLLSGKLSSHHPLGVDGSPKGSSATPQITEVPSLPSHALEDLTSMLAREIVESSSDAKPLELPSGIPSASLPAKPVVPPALLNLCPREKYTVWTEALEPPIAPWLNTPEEVDLQIFVGLVTPTQKPVDLIEQLLLTAVRENDDQLLAQALDGIEQLQNQVNSLLPEQMAGFTRCVDSLIDGVLSEAARRGSELVGKLAERMSEAAWNDGPMTEAAVNGHAATIKQLWSLSPAGWQVSGEALRMALIHGKMEAARMLLDLGVQLFPCENGPDLQILARNVRDSSLWSILDEILHGQPTDCLAPDRSLADRIDQLGDEMRTCLILGLLKENKQREAAQLFNKYYSGSAPSLLIQQMAEHYAERGLTKGMDMITSHYGHLKLDQVLIAAVKKGGREHVKHISNLLRKGSVRLALGQKWLIAEIASGNNDADVVQLLLKQGFISHSVLLGAAASTGSMEMVEYALGLLHQSTRQRTRAVAAAASNGHLQVVDRLMMLGVDGDGLSIALELAISRGHREVADFLIKQQVGELNWSQLLRVAIHGGQLDTVAMLLDFGIPSSLDDVRLSLDNCQLSVLQLLLSRCDARR